MTFFVLFHQLVQSRVKMVSSNMPQVSPINSLLLAFCDHLPISFNVV